MDPAAEPAESTDHPLDEPLNPGFAALLGLHPGAMLRFQTTLAKPPLQRCLTICDKIPRRPEVLYVVRDCPNEKCPDRLVYRGSLGVRHVSEFTADMGEVESVRASGRWADPVEIRVRNEMGHATVCLWIDGSFRLAVVQAPADGPPPGCPATAPPT